jgi:hypothetical protein
LKRNDPVEEGKLTGSDFIAKSDEGVLCVGVTPPPFETAWNIAGCLEPNSRETIGARIGQ